MKVLVICRGPAYGDEHRRPPPRQRDRVLFHLPRSPAITDDHRTDPSHRAALEDLADWVLLADNTVTF